MAQTVADIRALLQRTTSEEFAVLERSLSADTRKGVQQALVHTARRLEAQTAEQVRVQALYNFERELAAGKLAVGLDEVGRGPLAGPLTVAAVVLDCNAEPLEGLNDSKQLAPHNRARLAEAIRKTSLAWSIVNIEPAKIDRDGMSACLVKAFSQAISSIEAKGVLPQVVLLDGNPLRIDPREINVVHGDARCASIAAASVIAKVARDECMVAYDTKYPGYDFASSKGYGSKRHCAAISEKGLTPLHRRSFCRKYLQKSLFG